MTTPEPPESPVSIEDLSTTLYNELRRRAGGMVRNERTGNSVSRTVAVHEVWAELMGSGRVKFNDRNHLFAAFALAMSRFLIDQARARGRQRRGGDRVRVEWAKVEAAIAEESDPDTLLDLSAALEQLAAREGDLGSRYEQLARLKLFGVLTNQEVAEVLGVSVGTVEKDWKYVRARLGSLMSSAPAE